MTLHAIPCEHITLIYVIDTVVPDLDTLNADGPTVISSGEESVTDLTDCGDFLLPDLDSIIGPDDDQDALQGRQQNKNKVCGSI